MIWLLEIGGNLTLYFETLEVGHGQRQAGGQSTVVFLVLEDVGRNVSTSLV